MGGLGHAPQENFGIQKPGNAISYILASNVVLKIDQVTTQMKFNIEMIWEVHGEMLPASMETPDSGEVVTLNTIEAGEKQYLLNASSNWNLYRRVYCQLHEA